MNVVDLVAVVSSAVAALGVVGGGVTVVFKVVARLARIEAQYSNNGGSSLRDQTDRIEEKLLELTVAVAEVKTSFTAHLAVADNQMARVDRYIETHPATVVVQNAQPAPN